MWALSRFVHDASHDYAWSIGLNDGSMYASTDGARVPMFITARRGVPRDGNRPTILYGYGGFNICGQPLFAPAIAAWFERGGVCALIFSRPRCRRSAGSIGCTFGISPLAKAWRATTAPSTTAMNSRRCMCIRTTRTSSISGAQLQIRCGHVPRGSAGQADYDLHRDARRARTGQADDA